MKRPKRSQFFIEREQSNERRFQCPRIDLGQQTDRQRIESFHIASASAEVRAVALVEHEGITVPIVEIAWRHHIDMPRENQSVARVRIVERRSDPDDEVRFRFVGVALADEQNARSIQIIADEIDHRDVAVARDRIEGNETSQQFFVAHQ